MREKKFGLAALFAVAGAAVAISAAPIAVAEPACDPIASICEGPVQGTDSSPSFAPAPGTETGGAPSESQLTDENPGAASPESPVHR
jgi:hypothetical protein